MYSLKELHQLVLQKRFPDEDKISLKLYLEYYDTYFKESLIIVDNQFKVEITPSQVAHIMDIHAFYDANRRDKNIRFRGAFATIQAYRNIKKSVITLETLRSAKNGAVWRNNTIRNRVVGFIFLKEALLKGEWYIFKHSNFNGNTNVQADYIVTYQVKHVVYNVCIQKNGTNPYFCISNLVTYSSSNKDYYIRNQLKLQVARVTEISKQNFEKPLNVICHEPAVKNMLLNNLYAESCVVDSLKHNHIMNRCINFNSRYQETEKYRITYLKIDSNIERLINEK